MLVTIVLAFLAGFVVANGLAYFVAGSTGAGANPSPFPDSAVVNVVAGWLGMVVGGMIWTVAWVNDYPVAGYVAAAVGVLVVGLVHARIWRADPWCKRAVGGFA
jgi:hypothetical protein